jgi:hypothetical protein
VAIALAAHQDLGPLADKISAIPAMPGPLYQLALSRFSLDPQIYLDRLNVLALRDRIVAKGAGVAIRRDVDILANGVGVWPSVKDARTARIAQGVTDTALENVLIGCVSGVACSRAPSTSELYAGANGKGWAVVAAPHGPATADREAGYTIVAATATPASWWRIDPATGETLGMNPFGGDEATEYLMQQRALVGNYIIAMSSLARCMYGVATATSGGADRLVTGGRCVAAATVGYLGGYGAIMLAGNSGLVLGVLIQSMTPWLT